MIKVTDIYAATRHGLDIILYYYPQAEGCIDNKNSQKNGKIWINKVSVWY